MSAEALILVLHNLGDEKFNLKELVPELHEPDQKLLGENCFITKTKSHFLFLKLWRIFKPKNTSMSPNQPTIESTV